MRKLNWIIFKYKLPGICIVLILFVLYFHYLRGHWLGLELISWLIFYALIFAATLERRESLDYWIKCSEGDVIRDTLHMLGFHKVMDADGHTLYRKKMRWTASYFAILTTEDALIKLRIAQKFEKQLDNFISPDQLYRPKPVPTRRRWYGAHRTTAGS